MTRTAEAIEDEHMKYLIELIGKPTLKYMMRRIQNHILCDADNKDMSINSFITIIVVSLATIDSNFLRWIQSFYKEKVGEDIDFDKLRFSLAKNVNEQLGIEVH